MMCEHELRGEEAWAFLVNSLATANARASEAEQQFSVQYVKTCRAEQRAEKAEARCAAYKKALDIAMSTNQSHETYCKVEAALEGKP